MIGDVSPHSQKAGKTLRVRIYTIIMHVVPAYINIRNTEAIILTKAHRAAVSKMAKWCIVA